MKVISLLQPWASLAVLGHKKLETRSFNTKHRGPLLIHACKNPKFVETNNQSCDGELIEWLEKINMLYQSDYAYPFGAIIGQVNIVDTFQFSDDAQKQLQAYKAEENPWIPYREGGNNFDSLEEEDEWQDNIIKEMAFGVFDKGRYGWLLSNPIVFEEPIPAKGMQGFWNYDLHSVAP